MFNFNNLFKKFYQFEEYANLEFHEPYVCYKKLSTKKVYFFDY